MNGSFWRLPLRITRPLRTCRWSPGPATIRLMKLTSARCGVSHPRQEVCPESVPHKDSVNFIKRIVAGPRDHLRIDNGRVILNGKPQKEPFIRPCPGDDGCDYPREVTIPAGHYFMMGDNRGSSDDSRFWGPVPKKWIIGAAFATYWPPKRIGLL